MMELKDLIKNRRSIRKFKSKKVEKEKIEKILESGRWAPSANNRQPWRFYAIKTKKYEEEISKIAFQDFLLESYWIILVTAKKREESKHKIDTGLAIENIVLTAYSLGLGSCIVGWFDRERTKEIFNIPKEYEVLYLISIGYPDEEPTSSRKSLDEIVEWL